MNKQAPVEDWHATGKRRKEKTSSVGRADWEIGKVTISIFLVGKTRLGKAEEWVHSHMARSGWVWLTAKLLVMSTFLSAQSRAAAQSQEPHPPGPGLPSTHLVLVFHLQGNVRGRCLLTVLPIDQRSQAVGQEKQRGWGWRGQKRREEASGACLASLLLPGPRAAVASCSVAGTPQLLC